MGGHIVRRPLFASGSSPQFGRFQASGQRGEERRCCREQGQNGLDRERPVGHATSTFRADHQTSSIASGKGAGGDDEVTLVVMLSPARSATHPFGGASWLRTIGDRPSMPLPGVAIVMMSFGTWRPIPCCDRQNGIRHDHCVGRDSTAAGAGPGDSCRRPSTRPTALSHVSTMRASGVRCCFGDKIDRKGWGA